MGQSIKVEITGLNCCGESMDEFHGFSFSVGGIYILLNHKWWNGSLKFLRRRKLCPWVWNRFNLSSMILYSQLRGGLIRWIYYPFTEAIITLQCLSGFGVSITESHRPIWFLPGIDRGTFCGSRIGAAESASYMTKFYIGFWRSYNCNVFWRQIVQYNEF